MKILLQRFLSPISVVSMVFVFATSTVNAVDDILLISIDVAPNVLNIQSNSVIVTVHTNIAYSAVDVNNSLVYLNDIEIDWWKADNRGNFVAKFNSDEVKDLELSVNDYNLLELAGYTTDGIFFHGFQDIMVIDNVPKGNK